MGGGALYGEGTVRWLENCKGRESAGATYQGDVQILRVMVLILVVMHPILLVPRSVAPTILSADFPCSKCKSHLAWDLWCSADKLRPLLNHNQRSPRSVYC